MRLFREDKQAHFKIVYHGAGLCGKTTNMHQIFRRLQPEQKLTPEIVEIPTQQDKTLSFDFMPLSIGKIGAYAAVFEFYTVPGQVHYQSSRKLILDGVDGVVFVADSQNQMKEENIRMLEELKSYLRVIKPNEEIPIALQFNKRDLFNVMPVEMMLDDLQEKDEPWFEGSALSGEGVMETMQTIVRMVLANMIA